MASIFEDAFLSPLGSAKLYITWRLDNPKDAARFDTVVNRIKAGTAPTWPTMSTAFGRALIGACKLEWRDMMNAKVAPGAEAPQTVYP